MKRLLLLATLIFISCGTVDEAKAVSNEIVYEESEPAVEAAVEEVVVEDTVTWRNKVNEKLYSISDNYTLPEDFQFSKTGYTHQRTGEQFEVEYYVFTNTIHTNGYVIIVQYNVLSNTNPSDENEVDGYTVTIKDAKTPAYYIGLVDNGLQAITLEKRALVIVFWKVRTIRSISSNS